MIQIVDVTESRAVPPPSFASDTRLHTRSFRRFSANDASAYNGINEIQRRNQNAVKETQRERDDFVNRQQSYLLKHNLYFIREEPTRGNTKLCPYFPDCEFMPDNFLAAPGPFPRCANGMHAGYKAKCIVEGRNGVGKCRRPRCAMTHRFPKSKLLL